MGVCSARQQTHKSAENKQNFNPALASTNDQSQIHNTPNQPHTETKTSLNQTGQRKLRKSGTLSYFEIEKHITPPESNLKNSQRKAPSMPQLKIKVNDTIASKDYSVYMGKVKLRNRPGCRVMQHNSDGRLVVLHTINYDQDGKDYIDWLQKTDLDYYMISKVHEVFINNKQIQIITEYCSGGTLSELLQFNLSEQVICNLLEQMLEILKFLHKNKLSHNQLTMDSFSFYYDLQNYLVKLTDLQSLHKIQPEETLEMALYSSPEFLSSKQAHKSNDIWSVAVIAYQLLSKQMVYQDGLPLTTIVDVKRAITKWVTKQTMNFQISNDFGCLLLQMFKLNRLERSVAEDCLNHSFIVRHYHTNLKCVFQYQFQTNLEGLPKMLLKYFLNNYELQHRDVVYRIFSILDKDKNGKLSEQELVEFQRRLSQEANQQQNIEILAQYIANKQEIYFEEFLFMICNKSIYFTTQNLKHSYKKLSNKNGEITVKSLSKFLCTDEEIISKEFVKHNLQYEVNQYANKKCYMPIEYELYEQMMNQFLVVSKEQ